MCECEVYGRMYACVRASVRASVRPCVNLKFTASVIFFKLLTKGFSFLFFHFVLQLDKNMIAVMKTPQSSFQVPTQWPLSPNVSESRLSANDRVIMR